MLKKLLTTERPMLLCDIPIRTSTAIDKRPIPNGLLALLLKRTTWGFAHLLSTTAEVVKALERITDKGQAQFGLIMAWLTARSGGSSLKMSSIIGLVNLISREVSRVNVRS